MANTMRDKIKETLDTTPQAVRWLLMIAAFVVVLMLLVLLIGRPNKNVAPVVDTGYDITLTVTPNNADFSNTPVGTKRTQVFRINATHDAIYAFEINTAKNVYSGNTETKRNILIVQKSLLQ